jgi:GntR family transcriptional regulator
MPPQQNVIRIDLASETPAYRQIVDAVRAALVRGAALPGDQLPPIRQLATDLGVHFNTVAEAYRILADEGWLDLKRRRGAVVLHREAPRNTDPEKLKNFARRIGEIVAELRAAGIPAAAIAKELKIVAEGLQR